MVLPPLEEWITTSLKRGYRLETSGSSDEEWRERTETSNPPGVKRGNQSYPAAGGLPSGESAGNVEGSRNFGFECHTYRNFTQGILES